MPYINIERTTPERNTKLKCKLCGHIIKSRPWRDNHKFIISHVHEHHQKEWDKIQKEKDLYERELEKLKRKYPLYNEMEGRFFESLSIPKRMWKCPDCGKILPPSQKYYHEQNRKLYCKPYIEKVK